MCQVLYFTSTTRAGYHGWLLQLSIDNRRVANGWNLTFTTQEVVYTDLCFTRKAEYCSSAAMPGLSCVHLGPTALDIVKESRQLEKYATS